MSKHHATIDWQRSAHATEADTFSRRHQATVNGGQTIDMSAAAESKGDADAADPEQLLLTSLASCHMLTFLAIADLKGYHVERYHDTPVAYLEKNIDGRMAVTRIELSPQIRFGGDAPPPDDEMLERLHDSAHRSCFIANSITTRVTIKAVSTAD